MRKFVLWLLAVVPFAASAQTWLCIPEVGAFVADGGGKAARAGLANVQPIKWLQTHEKGRWTVKQHGSDYVLFDKCDSEQFCERSDGYGGTFLRDPKNGFTIIWMTQKDGQDHLWSAKGKCSKL